MHTCFKEGDFTYAQLGTSMSPLFIICCSALAWKEVLHWALLSAFLPLHTKCGGSYQSLESFAQQHCLGLVKDVSQIQVEAGLMFRSSKLFTTQPFCGSIEFRSWRCSHVLYMSFHNSSQTN